MVLRFVRNRSPFARMLAIANCSIYPTVLPGIQKLERPNFRRPDLNFHNPELQPLTLANFGNGVHRSQRPLHCTISLSNQHADTRNLPQRYSTKFAVRKKVTQSDSQPSKPWPESQQFINIRSELVAGGKVGLITMTRSKVLNALSESSMHEILEALKALDDHKEVGAMVITGEGKAFAAGADIKEMSLKSFVEAQSSNMLGGWDGILNIKKPMIAAVNGYALGGGCELAMMCDIIVAGERAVFGQPEIKLGVLPGMGATQRLIRAVGKSTAMELILTGENFLSAEEALKKGLASRLIVGDNKALLDEAVSLAEKIAQKSHPVVALAKLAINGAYEMGLSEGLKRERSLFHATFALEDQKEGMAAFLEKRDPQFRNK